MADARSEEERLPWLDSPRAPKRSAAPRRTLPRAPIFTLLALFLLASVGVMSFLIGRGSVPIAPPSDPAPMAPAATKQATVTLPPPPPPLPAPLEQIASAPAVAERPTTAAMVERPVTRSTSAATRASRQKARARAASQARAAPSRRALRARRAIRQMPPLVRASPVVQLGVYRTRGQANAAFRRLTKVYPYLKKLPRDVRPVTYSDNTRLYRLRLREYSPEYARILCGNLRSLGRGCTVLPVA